MNLFDLLALLVLLAAVLAGIGTGALPQVGGIGGAIAGLLLALGSAHWLVDVTRGLEPLTRALVVLGAIIGAVFVGEAIGSGIGRAAAGRMGRGVLSSLDRFVGGLLGAGQAVLIVWLAGGLIAAGPFPSLARTATTSLVVRSLDRFLPTPTEVVGEIATALDGSGLPDVFVGLEPIPLPPVDLPGGSQASALAKGALASTARVTSRACQMQISGTGTLIAHGYLVTNAHVVAGARTIRATIGGTTADATPVLFDPNLDVALLYVPGLDGPALRFAASDPARGAQGAALGYAGGGALTILPASVTGDYPATGRDIYGRQQITRRILELRAGVEPGDSGGPLIMTDGTIGGVVFAQSRTEAGVGYALTPTSVAVRVASAIGRTSAVSTGACLN